MTNTKSMETARERTHTLSANNSHTVPEIGVVHLVRANNGIEPFKTFLKSYQENPAGIDHELLIIFKGFSRKHGVSEYEQLLQNIPHQAMFLKDIGFDIEPYFKAAQQFDHKYLCFVNSFSIIQDKDWLLKMYRYISKKDVGLVGTTGSYQSIYSDWLSWRSRKKKRPLYKKFLVILFRRYITRVYKQYFDPFPNYHIRTNAFMLSRELMCRLRRKPIRIKLDAYRFESGSDNMTKQIMRMNLKVFVVGKDGVAYKKEEWYKSNTFWQRDQRNLLIADKQTKIYATRDFEDILNLSQFAWSDKATPHVKQGSRTDSL